MTTTQFDATAYKANQRALWNAQSAAWESWFGEFERGAGELTARLLYLVQIEMIEDPHAQCAQSPRCHSMTQLGHFPGLSSLTRR